MTSEHQPPAIIFDFDGTLADDFDLGLRVLYELTKHRPMPPEDVSRLRGLSARQLFRELCIPFWQVPLLVRRARRALTTKLHDVELVSGITAAVQKLAKTHKLFVLSSNSGANVQQVLERYGLTDSFVAVYGDARPLHKERNLRWLLRRYSIEPENVWYVGDEVRDIEAAHKAGVRIAAVSWGYNNIGALEEHRPDALVFTPEELVSTLTKPTA